MNPLFSPRHFFVLFLALLGIAWFATAAFAGDSAILQANVIYELVADRGRMIQVSLIFVALGCALIWWYR
ncbi:MAG: hypothetical protein FJ303_17265 [Planctomycetes bacterium]|nr:hypothetical protein [Planctomycetota bacterium]